MRTKPLIAALLLPVFCVLAPAAVSASQCEILRNQLNQVRSVTGNTAEIRRFSNALTRQTMNIRKVRGDLQRYGCSSGSIVFFGGNNKAACNQLQASLADMEENRRALESQRQALQGNLTSGSQERRRILAALRDNDCDGFVRDASFVTPQPVEKEKEESEFFTRIPSPGGGTAGDLRTMCVRTCDGAFFPISSNASTADFQRDSAICNRMCPAAETRLYYHSLTGSESSDMVSATTGEPYRALPSAFAYRNRMPGEKPICGCGSDSAGFSTIDADRDSSEHPKIEAGLRPIIETKPKEPAATPVTAASQATVPERPYDPANSRVRVVGPQFLPNAPSGLQPGNAPADGQ
ncbi:DUF2865 domain-containing protein [Rhizobiaceae bacterium BDR2-2]|uniref:DUF2865 domain-containing protein n=1 Tax=Ectorhizobium quercum TaxID=2965071 RepID=A0AAE3N0M1_9HYPH|nr:DUF2865 domain-containing protein [Ectorhizobium quercum]MCX8997529.1 DUF2865 domain-containing protein [Ectorhizobium quercum]